MEITADRVVLIHYTLKGDDGTVIDTSAGSEPLAYIQGHGNLVAGLEKALEVNRKAAVCRCPSRLRKATASMIPT